MTTPQSAQTQEHHTRSTIIIALLANLLIVAAKAIGGVITGSPALLSEAAHSVADSVNELFLLAGVKHSRRHADARHPFGYGKARYFYSMLAAVGIFVTGGCFSFYQGLRALESPTVTDHFPIAFLVLALSFLADGSSLVRATWQVHGLARSQGRGFMKTLRDPSDPAVATVLAEDSTAVVGVLLAAAGLGLHAITGSSVPEGIAALAIAVLLALTAWRLGRSAEALLIGQAADPVLIRQAYLALDEEPEVDTILAFLTMRMGIHTVLLAARIDLSDGLDSDSVEAVCGRIKSSLARRFPALEQIFLDITDATEADRQTAARRRGRLLRDAQGAAPDLDDLASLLPMFSDAGHEWSQPASHPAGRFIGRRSRASGGDRWGGRGSGRT